MIVNPVHLLWMVPLLGMLLWAAVEDSGIRKIRNWLTFSMMLSGFLQTFLHGSEIGPWQSVSGFGVGVALGLVMYLLGAVTGGDLKLLAGIGAWLGPWGIFQVFCAQAVVGMVIVVVQAIAQGRLALLTRNSAMLAVNLIHLNEVGIEHVSSTGQSCQSIKHRLPYAVPVLMAVIGLALAGAI